MVTPKKKSCKKSPAISSKAVQEKPGTGKHPGGRPSPYNAEYFPKIAQLLAAAGKIDTEIAKELGVSEVTLNAWKKDHPEFLKALKEGKSSIDQQVENALLRRALGYTYTETKRFLRPLFDNNGDPVIGKDGKQVKASVREEITDKAVVPDVTAQIFWLTNRKRDTWRRNATVEPDFEKGKAEINEIFERMKKEGSDAATSQG